MRQLERIEEKFMRKILNTTKGCPIVSLYLTLGHIPARFEIQKMKLLYLKYILSENEESLIRKFFYLQLEIPTKGGWASSCLKDLRELEIKLSLKNIEEMPYNEFKRILKEIVREKAFLYLKNKIRSKGKENLQNSLYMTEYLLPENKLLTTAEKQRLFAVKNK